MKQKQNFTQLLKPRSIAIIGASGTNGKVGNMIAHNVISYGYDGDVFFINPKRKTIFEKKCYSNLIDIGHSIDCAIVVVPGRFVENVIKENAEVCKNFVVISAGFGETGTVGHNREMSLRALAEEKNIKILGPNCLGFLTPSIKLNASFAEGLPKDGHIAVISQSGALAVAIMDKAREEKIGFSSIVSIGNKMQIGAPELIEYFCEDVDTSVIALYLEGIDHGKSFLNAVAKAVTNGKKVIVLKAGSTKEAQKAIALHTGSLAGSNEIFTTALQKVGALRADSMSEFFALIRIGECYKDNFSNTINVCIVTNAGGPGVLTTDIVASLNNIEMSNLSNATKLELTKVLPDAASVHNPIDLLGDATLKRYECAIQKVLSDKNVDTIFILLTPQDQTPVNEIAKMVVKMQQKTKKLFITSFIGGERVKKAIKFMNDNGVLHFNSPKTALNALSIFVDKRNVHIVTKNSINKKRVDFVQKIINKRQKQTSLYFDECRKIAKKYNINVSKFWDITKGLDAKSRIKYPCVVKVDNPNILHKTDRGGIILPIKNLKELYNARRILLNKFSEVGTRIIAQPMFSVKTELIIGFKRDPIFGVVVIAGLGGIYTEIFKRIDFYITPLTLREIKNTLKNGNISFLFNGARGIQKYNINSVANVIYNMALIGIENPQIKTVDINPLLVYNNDVVDVAVDFKIILHNSYFKNK